MCYKPLAKKQEISPFLNVLIIFGWGCIESKKKLYKFF